MAEVSHAVRAGGVRHAEARDRLGEDALALAHRERLEGLVFQVPHRRRPRCDRVPSPRSGKAAAGGVGELARAARAASSGAG